MHNQGTLLKSIQNDGKTDPKPEMLAYDQLGPLTKKAIGEFPVPFSAEMTLMMIKNHRVSDKQMAARIVESAKEVDAEIRKEYETMPILHVERSFKKYLTTGR